MKSTLTLLLSNNLNQILQSMYALNNKLSLTKPIFTTCGVGFPSMLNLLL